MKLYHHYKNKPYKYIGTARHSESLDEVVIYETRYPNELAKLWVRPKGMFFEPVELNGEMIPRFKQIPLKILETSEITKENIRTIAPLIEKSFGDWDPKWFHSTFDSYKRFYLTTAYIGEQAVAFKLGYELNTRLFYSWLGGVIGEYRGLGIASALMTWQHEWCRKNGYVKIQTKTQNRFQDMLILNLKHGFAIIGTHESDEKGLKIILEKKLI